MGNGFRHAFAPCRGEGENVCVLGPNNEILIEVTHGSIDQQWMVASLIAELLCERTGTRMLGQVLFQQVPSSLDRKGC